MPQKKQPSFQHTDVTSVGVPWSELSGVTLRTVDWMDGRHGPAPVELPSPIDLPVPQVLFELPSLHELRPRGTKAMMDAQGARFRLASCRAGAWLISPLTGHKWAKWPSGDVGWLPKDILLPDALRVHSRNDSN